MRGPRTMSPRAATRVATALAVFAALFHPAAGSAAVQVTLIGRMKLPNSVLLTNVVGYSDARTRREYALIGDSAERQRILDRSESLLEQYSWPRLARETLEAITAAAGGA